MEEVTEDESISHEAAAFYSEIRGLVVVFLFFVILFSTAHLTLQHFVAKSISPDTKQDRADRTVHQMVLGICTFTLTISLTGYSLLPFSIVINEILVGFKHSYYVQWLNTGLIKDLALIVNIGTKIVCVLLPFSYFLLIAQGLRGTTNAFGSRLLEAICLLTFSFVLVFGTIWSVGTFLKALHTAAFGHSDLLSNIEFFSVHPVSFLVCSISSLSWTEVWTKFVLQTFVRSLECIQLLLSLLGLILLFACTPVGLLSIGFYLLTISISSLPDLKDKGLFSDQLAEVHFSALCIKDSRQSALLICDENPTWYDAMSILSHEELNYPLHKYPSKAKLLVFFNEKLVPLQLNYGRLKVRAAHNVTSLMKHWFRPLAPCLVLGVIFCLLYLMESFVFFNIINLVQHLLVGHLTAISYESSLTDVKPELIGDNGSTFALGHKSASAFGRVGAFLQVRSVVCCYFTILYIRVLERRRLTNGAIVSVG
ncbi:hypothetical protein PHET_08864 [Paragonimus heterotremus]|uniref:Uncharacterized protein n=1 Tax=Paragonimus heterotremus TaxID=100268 RepID=A0A8J4SHA0_9TREM|nr:hypothetical protein PHET_08864 [Paragonimus heterotremus]